MAGIASPAFSEVERKISSHNLRISIDLSKENNQDGEQKKSYIENIDSENHQNFTESKLQIWFSNKQEIYKYIGIIVINIIVLTYLVFASLYWSRNNNNCVFEWCDGYGMFLLLVSFTYFSLCYYFIIKKYFSNSIKYIFRPFCNCLESINQKRYASCSIKVIFYLIVLASVIVFLINDTIGSRDRLISCVGLLVMLSFGLLISKHPRKINWRPVIWGLILQFGFGLLTIRWSVGRLMFQCISGKVAKFLNYAESGSKFVFSDHLVDAKVFAFSALPVIFFFSFIIQILYYLGAMQWIILKLGWALHAVMGTTVCESLNAAANTFLGMTESPLLIKPYITKLTSSEIHSVMCSGFASVSGTVLAAYISFGAQPSHLITASLMAAPASLSFSKLLYPETEKSQTTFKNIPMQKSEDTSVMDAATKGAMAGIPLVLGIIANIVAFVSFISFFNAILSWLGGLVGFADLTFEFLLSRAFMPLSWIIGVPWDQCEDVGTLIGLKTVVNEFVAYQKLGELKKLGKLTPRVEGIATFAICGFANPGSVGIMMGGLGALAPEKREQIAAVAIRAFIGGSIVCFMSASIAGMLMNDDFLHSLESNRTLSSF
ncbi:solute carrier family 28 member 3 [Microplitis demolitor]|uniref:solute carrier family 28 member 3 n=1 Tax=Microplitis demolitor TaxID=69319 RepID=UPI0004CCC3CF|nr:solute carrier family 28 member 3 [Microplitis demolitor]